MTRGEFDGLVALVTGAGSGIGLAAARLLGARGAHVVAFDLDPSAAAPMKRVPGDVTDDDAVRAGVAEAVAAFGRLDVVVNNAGIGAQGTVEDNPLAEWRRVLDVNVLGIVRVSRAALPHLRRSPAAAIVNTCSIAATAGLPDRAAYSASKGAVLSLTLAMAADHVREGVRVNCVNPGTADTPWVGRLLGSAADPDAERAALEARQPIGRLVTAEEIAHAIAYLASPLSGSTTGTVLAVDGGMAGLRLRPDPEPAGTGRRAGTPDLDGGGNDHLLGAGSRPGGERQGAGTSCVALHTRIRPGLESEYEKAHREVPAELTDAIRRAGVRSWTIWRSGTDLFHLVDCDDYPAALARLQHDPVNVAWQARMADLLDVVHDYSAAGADAGLPVVWTL